MLLGACLGDEGIDVVLHEAERRTELSGPQLRVENVEPCLVATLATIGDERDQLVVERAQRLGLSCDLTGAERQLRSALGERADPVQVVCESSAPYEVRLQAAALDGQHVSAHAALFFGQPEEDIAVQRPEWQRDVDIPVLGGAIEHDRADEADRDQHEQQRE
jgi:hypothetical protein